MNSNSIGGIADKLGNDYEAKWVVRQLLDVARGQAHSLRFEGITAPFAGFEVAVQRDARTEWHQTKMNAPHGNWTVGALERDGVLNAFAKRLQANSTDCCFLVSQDPARDVRVITEKAVRANDASELVGSLSNKERQAYYKLKELWAVDDTVMQDWLSRCSFLTIPTAEIESYVETIGSLLFDGNQIFGALRVYLEDRFNKLLTTEAVRSELQHHSGARLRHWQFDATLIERIIAETDGYLASHGTLGCGGRRVARRETAGLADMVCRDRGPGIILLTGVAGAGKSGVVRELIDVLRNEGIQHLAFRVDYHLDECSPRELGLALTGRNESPAVTLKGLSSDQPTVLIADQVDAVSDAAGRSGQAKAAILELADSVRALGSVKLVLVCRTFDLSSDARLKQLKQNDDIAKVEVQLLDWDTDIEPLLTSLCIDVNALSPSQRELLRLPLNLGLFVELSGEGGGFASRGDLFEALLERKERAIRQKHGVSWSLYQPLGAAVDWMSERQRLDAPVGVLARFAGAVDILASEHLIICSRGKIGLFHESLFDHLYAREFTTQPRSLRSVLTSSEQHLFRRTQARQILEALRQADWPRYLHELKEVLQSRDIRFHVKHSVALWLGAVTDPTLEELQIILALDDGGERLPQLVGLALLGSSGWFDLLLGAGWIERELGKGHEDRLNRILHWLSKQVGERAAEIGKLLEAWWDGNQERGQVLLRWLGLLGNDGGNEALTSLCEAVVRTCGGEDLLGRSDYILSSWVGRRPREGARILRALSDGWFSAHPGKHPFERDEVRDIDLYDLEQFAKKSPAMFLDGAIPMLVRSLGIINARKQSGQTDYTFSAPCRHGEVFGTDRLIALYRASFSRVAATEPDEARRLLSELNPRLHRVALHLHLETIAASKGGLAADLLPLLDLEVAEAGWEGAEWKSFADAARCSLPHLQEHDRMLIKRFIINLMPEIQRAAKMARAIKEKGIDAWRRPENVIWLLNRSGECRWAILETIGVDLLFPRGRAALAEGRRKFRDRSVPFPHEMRAGWVRSPIPRDRAERMPDAQWLRAIEKYGTNERLGRGHFLEGGASQLACELQHLTKSDPARFVGLLGRIPYTANPTYIDHILWGVAEATEVDIALVSEAVRLASGRPGRDHEGAIVRLFERCPRLASDPARLELLLWIGEHGAANESEVVESSTSTQELITIEDLISKGSRLHIHGMNGVRGAAAEALEQVIWNVPSSVGPASSFMERRIAEEKLISVRCCLVRPLLALFNSDKKRCATALERLVGDSRSEGSYGDESDEWISPLATHAGTHLLPYIIAQVPDVGRRLVERLLNSSNETFRLIGAWHVLRASYSDNSYTNLADKVARRGVGERRLAAALAADAAVHDSFRDRAEQELVRYFDDEDGKTRGQAAGVFREIRAQDFREYRRLATAYVASQAFDVESWGFLHLLESGAGDVQDLVVAAAERVVRDIEREGTAHGRRVSELHTLQDLIRRDYAATENDSQLRARLLDVIDAILAGDYYGSETIVKDHDR